MSSMTTHDYYDLIESTESGSLEEICDQVCFDSRNSTGPVTHERGLREKGRSRRPPTRR